DGAPPHYTSAVRNWLNENFHNKWIGRGGPRSPRSPYCSPCDFFLWGYIKEIVFRTPVENVIELRSPYNYCACTKNVEKKFLKKLQK
ncbi:hypothetical protein WH47_09800, partial [Habropoda laboriosa]